MFGYCYGGLVVTDVMKERITEGMCMILSNLTTSFCTIRAKNFFFRNTNISKKPEIRIKNTITNKT